MSNFKAVLMPPSTSILSAIRIIDESTMQIALVIDEQRRLLGTVTDGDIRRAILKGIRMEDPVRLIMNPKPTVVTINAGRGSILEVMKQKRIHQIPVVDDNGCVVGLEILDQVLKSHQRENWVVLMAGGLGTRLHPLTEDCPKPLLKIGGKPLLQTILENFREYGFYKFYISVNYKAEMIQEYFGDGSNMGVEIRYIYESKRMGTAGALGLFPKKPAEPIIVMNGDLLTKVNFVQLLDFHFEHKAKATMCVREYNFQVPYGVVRINRHRLIGIDEKPVHRFFISAGIYVVEPSALDLIPQNTFFDMPNFFKKMIDKGYEICTFPIREYWLDIGQVGDFEKANGEYDEHFSC